MAQGRLWVGTIYEPRDAPKAALYCWFGKRLQRIAGGVTVSNGLAFSPDGATVYWSDTAAHRIDTLTLDPVEGSVSDRRVFMQFPSKPTDPDQGPAPDPDGYGGRPDGAAVDAEGHCWVAMFEGQRLLRLSPQGQVVQSIALPVRCPTMPCFGGPDLRTSVRHHGQQPPRCRTGRATAGRAGAEHPRPGTRPAGQLRPGLMP